MVVNPVVPFGVFNERLGIRLEFTVTSAPGKPAETPRLPQKETHG
jgi:hypothetical protein